MRAERRPDDDGKMAISQNWAKGCKIMMQKADGGGNSLVI